MASQKWVRANSNIVSRFLNSCPTRRLLSFLVCGKETEAKSRQDKIKLKV